MNIVRTNSEDENFVALVKELDQYLALKDGEEHQFYVEFNKIDGLKHCVVAYENENPVGCGAIRFFDEDSMEIKRMFVKPEHRKKGIGSKILSELENWTKELGKNSTVLETGKRQEEAVNLYEKTYSPIPNYGQYKTADNSLCFKKML